MTFADYLLHLYYLIDSELNSMDLPQIRSRGPAPKLADSEVITMELAGEFQRLDTDQGIYAFFLRYHRQEFPKLAEVDRTTFARQAANLWRVKQLLHERLLARLPLADEVDGQPLWILDSFPVAVCRFARAKASKLFKGQASYGYDATARSIYFGFRVHLRISDRGPIAALQLTPAHAADMAVARDLAPKEGGWGIGDRAYWDPQDCQQLAKSSGFVLEAPFRKRASDPAPARSKTLMRLRRLIETVNGQIVERFHGKRVWARDLWHLCSRLIRKVLSHTAAVLLNNIQGNPPLQLALLING